MKVSNSIGYFNDDVKKRKEALKLIERWVLELEKQQIQESNSYIICSQHEDELYG